MADGPKPTILCVASYYKGDRFLERLKEDGCRVLLLTAESYLNEPWPRHAIDEVFALPNFQDRRQILNAVTFLARTRSFRHIVALDDFDVELVAFLRDHMRLPGLNESRARLCVSKSIADAGSDARHGQVDNLYAGIRFGRSGRLHRDERTGLR